MLEFLKISSFSIGFFLLYSFVSNDDYHKKFDKPIIIEYNCNNLGYDAPKDIVEVCTKTDRRLIIVKAY